MPTIPLAPGDYWRLRFLQERIDHAQTRGLLAALRAVQAHADVWGPLVLVHPELATGQWVLTDADTSLSTPDPPPTSVTTTTDGEVQIDLARRVKPRPAEPETPHPPPGCSALPPDPEGHPI